MLDLALVEAHSQSLLPPDEKADALAPFGLPAALAIDGSAAAAEAVASAEAAEADASAETAEAEAVEAPLALPSHPPVLDWC